ncbi:transporter [Methylobacterium gregans]|uniref:Uncharacterized protein n=2 Tax=Methylobacterium gregans TaxID=374424 RepID=A0AA37HTG7_9HYPH|nr:transporter [Methylobacterium gregans]MDQ0520342.1 hypothetical protein [Methylobacterium gregans]GJD81366.1 hypothetical protein NBEOAGPD_4612 [Methylobacterium gregans]
MGVRIGLGSILGEATRGLARVAVCLLAGALPAPAQDLPTARENAAPAGLDSEHLFGFVEGSDIGVPGEVEFEFEATGRFGRGGGRFRAVDGGLVLKIPLDTSFRVAPGIGFNRFAAAGVPGLADRAAGGLSGAFVETRLRFLDRRDGPFGLTLNVVPSVGRVDTGSGLPAESYGLDTALLADWEIVPGRLVAALNLGFSLAATRLDGTGERLRGSGLELAGALAYEARPGLFVGAEARYVQAFEGLGLDRFSGQAVYLGPTVYATLSPQAWASFTWSFQVAGSAEDVARPLDLTNFDRHQTRLRFGLSF